MPQFKSFATLDLETTDLNFPKITELSLIGIERGYGDSSTLPRPLNKLTIPCNPRSKIHPIASLKSGLDNEMLSNWSPFNKETVETIRTFLTHFPHPVCLIAHNGRNFDFPVLSRELAKTGAPTLEGIYCVDSLPAFREILSPKIAREAAGDKSVLMRKNDNRPMSVCHELMDTSEDEICLQGMLQYEKKDTVLTSSQVLNETTPARTSTNILYAPKKPKQLRIFRGNSTAVKKLDFGDCEEASCESSQIVSLADSRPKSWKLSDIYEFLCGTHLLDAHRAEADALALLECVLKVGPDFFQYADENAVLFSSIR